MTFDISDFQRKEEKLSYHKNNLLGRCALPTAFKERMSSIPITLGTVSKVRHQWDAAVYKDKDLSNAKAQQSSYNVLENPPAKYNDKLMNSIWGLYNRYAPPSFQKNSEGEASATKAVTLGGWCWNQHN